MLSSITQLIIDPEKKEIYRITYKFRNMVMRSLNERFGIDFLKEYVPSCRAVIWSECQRLLRCDFEKADVKIGPIGAASLANHGHKWIIESVINICLLVLECNANEKHSGQASRFIKIINCPKCANKRQILCTKCEGAGRIITTSADEVRIPVLTDDFDQIECDLTTTLCPVCKGTGTIPCDCSDNYIFQIPRGAKPGYVIMARGARTNKIYYGILEQKIVSPRPNIAIYGLYRFYNMQNIPWIGAYADITLEYAESLIDLSHKIMAITWLILGAIIGKFIGSWQTGVVIGISVILGLAILSRYIFRPKIHTVIRRLIYIGLPIIGAFVGHFLALWQSGVTIGVIMSGVILAFFLIGDAINLKLR